MTRPAYSIVIPTLNEAGQIVKTLRAARRAFGNTAEYIVVDGGSTDGTAPLARTEGALVLACAPGRGQQLEHGLNAARGDVTLFVHADTHLPEDASLHVSRALLDPNCVGGAFAFDFQYGHQRPIVLRVLARIIRLRSRVLRIATGDQTIFARTAVLRAAGGVPRDPLFEDVQLFRRLRKAGRVVILSARVRTSPRLFQRVGPLRLILLHLGLRALYVAGMPTQRLARTYEKLEGKGKDEESGN